ncbi:Hint domain-containing protein [Jannaschia pohangensis]|uniref:Hint domain-containing protein n=1 Tax=Jannaschia pohangensis TaxID=390807 RepID=A0A1I3RVZ3_9RHOB|nr:Hint domain-containing protein [Jannaschia pohangensis]SFJ50763.1 Hint domain-containing protein [Jannaschia pohangensis]
MSTQLSNAVAVNISETTAQFSFVGGTFTLGSGPFTDRSLSVQDNDSNFDSFSPRPDETQGAGRQTAQLFDGAGGLSQSGVASLQQVITLTHPDTGATVQVGVVRVSIDDGSFGNGATLAEVFIFDGPIDPTVTYSVTAINYSPGNGPSNTYAYSTFSDGAVQSGGVVCFVAGTLIRTARGEVPVQSIRPGDRVQTVDHGLHEVLWCGNRRFDHLQLVRTPRLRPVRIAEGMVGNDRPLLVSPQHRIVVGDYFVKACDLPRIAGLSARIARGVAHVWYVHLLLEDHQVLLANGAQAESLLLGPMSRRIIGSGGMSHVIPTDAPRVRGLVHRICRPMLPRGHLSDMRRALPEPANGIRS